jgi:hypothetical protein
VQHVVIERVLNDDFVAFQELQSEDGKQVLQLNFRRLLPVGHFLEVLHEVHEQQQTDSAQRHHQRQRHHCLAEGELAVVDEGGCQQVGLLFEAEVVQEVHLSRQAAHLPPEAQDLDELGGSEGEVGSEGVGPRVDLCEESAVAGEGSGSEVRVEAVQEERQVRAPVQEGGLLQELQLLD